MTRSSKIHCSHTLTHFFCHTCTRTPTRTRTPTPADTRVLDWHQELAFAADATCAEPLHFLAAFAFCPHSQRVALTHTSHIIHHFSQYLRTVTSQASTSIAWSFLYIDRVLTFFSLLSSLFTNLWKHESNTCITVFQSCDDFLRKKQNVRFYYRSNMYMKPHIRKLASAAISITHTRKCMRTCTPRLRTQRITHKRASHNHIDAAISITHTHKWHATLTHTTHKAQTRITQSHRCNHIHFYLYMGFTRRASLAFVQLRCENQIQ